MGEGRGVYRVLVGRPEGKRPLERPRRRWEDNIKMGLRHQIYLKSKHLSGSICNLEYIHIDKLRMLFPSLNNV
jgi:hypothetical protein